ncbi:hypothetical protein Aeqsu_1569 [Aequorivita sublithincola DSM 14238]|uniref:DUF4296 domain-containing protein n=1 Tax=Aequorivita sublithincola (strain DSM 14238 / LMG 21431 / ACAM 643 / 9-3) TaxID=746697 RepID=I3YVN6_AEQSU|nr:DUF4296 domain-containing protein [Aequorivita sublithincola]AFL81054.1 hypothetical protein Aeqsu_1569 [Aequorivita sublithincola DSM 14238]
MKQSIIFILFALVLFGCQDVNYPEKPKNLIAKDKMVDILTETYLDNAARSVDNNSIITKGIKMDSMVYKNFGIDSLQFVQSNSFYAADVNTYMEIVQEVEARLTKMGKDMDSIWEMKRDRKDSVNDLLKRPIKTPDPVKDSLI